MLRDFRNFAYDAAVWALSIFGTGVLKGAGLVDDAGIALGGIALWWGIRAYRKATSGNA